MGAAAPWPRLLARSLAPQADKGGFLPARFFNFHRHIHMSASFFPERKKKKCFIASSTKKEGSFHLQKSCRPWKTTKELKDTGFPSHLRHHQEVLPLLTCLHLLPTVVFSFLCFSFLPSDVSFLLQEEILPAPWAGRAPTHPRGKGRTSTTITTSLPPATSATALSIYKTQHLSSSLMHPVLIIPFGLCS